MQRGERLEQKRSGYRTEKEETPASVWREKEYLDGRIANVGVIILRTSGCSHFHEGGCSMCGYNIESKPNVTPKDIERQFESGMRELEGIEFLKIYTSGSFLDEREMPAECAETILKACVDKDLRLLFESRPEYVAPGRIDRALRTHEKLEIAVGLESSNDNILKYSINKGSSVGDYERAASVLQERGVHLRTYVLLKPPFLTEAEAVADAVSTMEFASRWSYAISLNPVNVQKGTVVERLWRDWSYRPPWLWSVLEVLKASARSKCKVVCDPTGGGKARGAHNCGKCDGAILDSIKAYSLSQDPSRLGSPNCSCKELWQAIMDAEGYVMGGTPDLQRFFRGQTWRSKMH
ncbi:MAG: archaeosine biosynthesis radical SAM protein RaSEA [Thermoplasmata archaeon]